MLDHGLNQNSPVKIWPHLLHLDEESVHVVPGVAGVHVQLVSLQLSTDKSFQGSEVAEDLIVAAR